MATDPVVTEYAGKSGQRYSIQGTGLLELRDFLWKNICSTFSYDKLDLDTGASFTRIVIRVDAAGMSKEVQKLFKRSMKKCVEYDGHSKRRFYIEGYSLEDFIFVLSKISEEDYDKIGKGAALRYNITTRVTPESSAELSCHVAQ